MTQDQLLILLLRIVLISGALSVTAFVAIYWRLAPWWRDPIGRTIVIKDILLALLLVPSILSLFFHFSRVSSRIAAWTDLALFAAMTPVMIWRCVIWIRIHQDRREDRE